MTLSRRRLLQRGLAGALLASAPPVLGARAAARVLVVGGGFGGATAARYLARWAPELDVTLVTAPGRYWTCPFSNTAVAGLRSTDSLEVDIDDTARANGFTLVRGLATDIDPVTRNVQLADGSRLGYDRMVLAPGIELDGSAIEGYDAAAGSSFPHAWEAGPQTDLLRRRLEAVPDGALVVITAPPNPYRCPPGPYERASLMAWWLQRHRPRSKLLLLDAKDAFTKDDLFRAAWAERYPDTLEWQGRSMGGALRAVDAGSGRLFTDFDTFTPDLACVIPPQRAAAIARDTGLDAGLGWCPVDARTFASTAAPEIHVIGDAAVANPMPKSAFAANSQAKAAAAAVIAALRGQPAPEPVLMNTCYSLVAPDAGISIAGAYGVGPDGLQTLPGTSGVSPMDAGEVIRGAEAAHARGWYASIVADAFGGEPL